MGHRAAPRSRLEKRKNYANFSTRLPAGAGRVGRGSNLGGRRGKLSRVDHFVGFGLEIGDASEIRDLSRADRRSQAEGIFPIWICDRGSHGDSGPRLDLADDPHKS